MKPLFKGSEKKELVEFVVLNLHISGSTESCHNLLKWTCDVMTASNKKCH